MASTQTSPRLHGRLKAWHVERAEGWIQPDQGGAPLPVQGRALQPTPTARQWPARGAAVSFVVAMEKGRPCAQQVTWQPSTSRTAAGRPAAGRGAAHQRERGGWRYAALWFGALVCAALAATVGLLPWVLPAYALLSVCCGGVYWYDKRQAQAGAWRTPESTLHLLALLGGWPGALLAQQWLRHKSSKTAFRRVFWCTVALNLLALVALHLLWFRPAWLWG